MTPGHEANTLDDVYGCRKPGVFTRMRLEEPRPPRLSPMLSTGHKVLWRVYKKTRWGP
jgi:hypothetical protein